MKLPVPAKLQKQMDEVSKAFAALDSFISELDFDPQDDSSVEEAIDEVRLKIDGMAAGAAGNPLLDAMSARLKERWERSRRAEVLHATIH
jgi:hypothetical protein